MHPPRRLHGRSSAFLWSLALLVLPGAAFAHPGPHHSADFMAGLSHPLTGIDHLLAMIAVGVWAMGLGRKAAWTLPAAFVVAMLAGSGLAASGIALPMIEPAIALSVVLIGIAVASGLRLPIAASSLLVMIFAVFHGYAHGLEAPSGGIAVGYLTGFVAATVMLHAVGLVAGHGLAGPNRTAVRQWSGSLIACVGTALLFV